MIKDIVNGLVETYKTNNPFELCDMLNINIMYNNLGTEIKGFFQRTPNGFEIIHINSILSYANKKYICAHELGHAILHVDLSISFFIENGLNNYRNKYESQADIFAAELLIPDNYSKCDIKNMSIEQLSCYFGVNERLIKYKFGWW
jgi:Zn-dependent peptidase ImmA (M78 family)